MLNKISDYITITDFISDKPQILLNKSERAKTIYGGLLSIVSIMLISAALITFGLDLFTKKTATMTYNQTPVKNVSYEFSQFPWMVALLDNGIKLLEDEDRYYNFLADLWTFTPDNTTGEVVMNLKRTTIHTERCDINKHFGEYKEYFKDVPYLTHHYCALPGQNVTLFGIYGSSEAYNFMDFWISTCVNDTSVGRTNCYPREKSMSRLVNTYISYQYLEYFIDHSNIESPGQLILSSNILPVSSTIYKRDFFYIRNIEYESDLGLIFTETVSQHYNQVSNFKETADLRPQGTVAGSFALVSVMMDNKIDEYKRRFTKFQEVLANVGGLFKGICLIATFINYFFFSELYYLTLMSGIFRPDEVIDWKEKEKEDIKKIEISSANIINTSTYKLMNKVPDACLTKSSKRLVKKPNDLRFNVLELMCVSCPTKSRQAKFKTYSMAKNYTEANLCIRNILSKLSEINKMKCFVFSNEQYAIYNSLPSPSYYNIDNFTEDIWEDLVFRLYKQSKKKLNIDLINEFKMKNHKGEIDQIFMKNLEMFEI